MNLVVRPLTSARWPDLEAIFNARGCSQARRCWCMYYRVSGAQGAAADVMSSGGRNKARLKSLARAGRPPGLIGYRGRVPVGWVSLGPRKAYAKLARSPVTRPVDDQPVWSIVCFVVPSEYRGQGVAQALLRGAVAYARKQGARLVEAYPVDTPGRSADVNLWFGTKSMYDKAGFVEVARRKPQRPLVRLRTSPRLRRAAANGARRRARKGRSG